jgi:ParB/RepB/Spo0J family partition protein
MTGICFFNSPIDQLHLRDRLLLDHYDRYLVQTYYLPGLALAAYPIKDLIQRAGIRFTTLVRDPGAGVHTDGSRSIPSKQASSSPTPRAFGGEFFGAAFAPSEGRSANKGSSMSEHATLRSIPLSAIRPSPFQYRTRFDDETQKQLVESMRVSGQSTPVLVRPLPEDGVFELVSGERRCRGAKELGWETIQAICEEMTDAEAAPRVVTENEVRSDANIMERAAGYKRLTQPPCSFTFEEIAHRYGLTSAGSVRRIVDLLDEPETIRGLLSRDRLGERHIRGLASNGRSEPRPRVGRSK